MNELANRGLGRTLLICCVLVACVQLGRGCYNPKITPHGLRCATPPSKECPDGFTCIGGFCEDSDGAGGTAGTGGSGGKGGGGGAGGTCATAITPLCQTPAGTATGCDPTCQTGCPCGHRCSATASGTGCFATYGTKKVGDVCQPNADDCAPGSICLIESCGTNFARCFRFCREVSTCGSAGVCGTPVNLPGGGSTGLRACNLGDQVPGCDPIAQTGCPDPALGCYPTNQGSKCECPGMAGEGASCAFTTDCAGGFTCVNNSTGAATCRKACRTSADCTGGVGPCTLSGAFGFCP